MLLFSSKFSPKKDQAEDVYAQVLRGKFIRRKTMCKNYKKIYKHTIISNVY